MSRRTRMLRAAVFALCVLPCGRALAVEGPPAAPADAKLGEARAAFETGAKAAAEGRWSDALSAFETSAALRPHATTTYNIGYCERALGRPTRARKHFAQALAQDQAAGGAELTAELRAATTKYLDEVRAQIATPTITIVPGESTISVDGRPLEKAPATEPATSGVHMLAGTRPPGPGEQVPSATFVLEIDAGAHEIVIVGPDGRSKVAHEFFPPGSSKDLVVDLGPPPKPVTVDHGAARRTWGFVLGGVGVVGLGVGTYFGLAARSTWDDAKAACPLRTTCATDEGSSLSADAKTQANIATIALVAGGAALVSGTILVLTSSTGERAAVTATAAPGGGFLTVVGRF